MFSSDFQFDRPPSSASIANWDFVMDGLNSSLLETPSDAITPIPETNGTDTDKRLQSYINSVPYQCESNEVMQDKLQVILSRFTTCARTRDWRSLSTWGGIFQCWLALKYPLAKSIRVDLVKLCYELILMPAADPNLVRSWADLLQRLIGEKSGGRRKLEPSDLELDWKPLWRVLQKELWPKRTGGSASRNMVNLLLYVAEKCRRYYPASEIPAMIEEMLPLFTKDTKIIIISCMLSFLPPTHPHLYFPVLFQFWEATNSFQIDDRMLDALGNLSEEHVAGKAGKAGLEGGAAWKDVGIFTTEQWTILVGKCLGSFHVPVAVMKGPSNTGIYADSQASRNSLKLKKTTNRFQSLAMLFVYSMAVDGPIRGNDSATEGFLAGSRALDALDRLIMSTESFFHPSNSGPWTLSLTTFVKNVASEFLRRWKEEEQSDCRTPVTQHLTPGIRRSLVTMLRTPCLLAMFSKDLIASSFSQLTLKTLALLEPQLIMPQVIEKAVGGLEVVNETHRTTAVLSTLAIVSQAIVSEKVWPAGQKHLLPLLELSLPGIDMNDPHKTMVTALFISTVAAHIKLGRATAHPKGTVHELMHNGGGDYPDSQEMTEEPVLSRAEERELTRDSTFLFEEWVPAFFRQVFRLYENLPEEGGKGNKAGGKTEEGMLSSVKTALDTVCQHLSDDLFDAALQQTYEYATSNAKPNAVRAFGSLISSLARANAEKTIDAFLPFCSARITEELENGASSIRTTSTHPAVPTDTTFHWNLAILRACLGYGGAVVLKHKERLLSLLSLLVDQAKNERGYSGTGRLITRLLQNVGGLYTVDERMANADEWNGDEFKYDHFSSWGKMYDADSVKIDWHVPSSQEIDFIIEVISHIAVPCMDVVESLLATVQKWDNVARNDFCRRIQALRSIWSALPTFVREEPKSVPSDCIDDADVPELLFAQFELEAGFVLTDPNDQRYQTVIHQRKRFAELLHRSSEGLRKSEGEDHIDAVIQISKAIDIYLLEYGITRGSYSSSAKSYQSRRESYRSWLKQKEFPRSVFVKRAQYYHHGRLYMHSLYRGRSKLEDLLLGDLVEMSLSQYTRVRKYGQSVLFNVCSAFARSTRFCLPRLMDALAPGSDPDRMKGALYCLGNKSTLAYALSDGVYMGRYILTLLECSHQDKTSIQDLVKGVISDSVANFTEESLSSDCSPLSKSAFEDLLDKLVPHFETKKIEVELLARAQVAADRRSDRKETLYNTTVDDMVDIATRGNTHWKYVQYSLRLLSALLRRDKVPTTALATLFAEKVCSPESATRSYSQRAVILMLCHVKMRTFSMGSTHALWLEEYRNPLAYVAPLSTAEQLRSYEPKSSSESDYVDKILTGFAVWGNTIKMYKRPISQEGNIPQWEEASKPALDSVKSVLMTADWFKKVSTLWGQESNRANSSADIRSENFQLIKLLVKIYGPDITDPIIELIEPLCTDSERFKQRAGVEMLLGIGRGSKHWPIQSHRKLWDWIMERVPKFFQLIKPDTRTLWESYFSLQLMDWDPRRVQALMDWILSLNIDFKSDSAFSTGKSLSLFTCAAENLGVRFNSRTDTHLAVLFDQADNGFAEVREQIALSIDVLLLIQWQPVYQTTGLFLAACNENSDPLQIRKAPHIKRIRQFAEQLPRLRLERLPPPRVAQSTYDRIGNTLLQWMWNTGHSQNAALIFPYVLPLIPEFFYMSELNDNAELVKYSLAVLFIMSSITPPADYIEPVSSAVINVIKTSQSWRVRQNALPVLLVFFYRNLAAYSDGLIKEVLDVFIDCLADENVEVRSTAAKVFAGVLRCSQRSQIPVLRTRFLSLEKQAVIPKRSDPAHNDVLRILHSAILGLCSLMDCFPYVVESWMPPLMEVFAKHSTDRPPISTTIRAMASDFKKTHQDTWQTDKTAFSEDELQALNTILVGTSYYA